MTDILLMNPSPRTPSDQEMAIISKKVELMLGEAFGIATGFAMVVQPHMTGTMALMCEGHGNLASVRKSLEGCIKMIDAGLWKDQKGEVKPDA